MSYSQLSAVASGAVQRRHVNLNLSLSSDGGGFSTFSTLLLPPFVPVQISRKSTISKLQPSKKEKKKKKIKKKEREVAVHTVSSDINVQI
jgi:hypothetical protein